MKESFDIGNPEDEVQPNIWLPEELLPGFRQFMEDFVEVQARRKVLFGDLLLYLRDLGLHQAHTSAPWLSVLSSEPVIP